MNKVLLCGNIVADGEMRVTENDKVKVNFILAINKKNGKGMTKTTFIPCIIWGKFGESVVGYLKKGSQLIVDGELEINNVNGEKGWKTFACVNVNDIQFGRQPKSSRQEAERNNKNSDMVAVDEDVPF